MRMRHGPWPRMPSCESSKACIFCHPEVPSRRMPQMMMYVLCIRTSAWAARSVASVAAVCPVHYHSRLLHQRARARVREVGAGPRPRPTHCRCHQLPRGPVGMSRHHRRRVHRRRHRHRYRQSGHRPRRQVATTLTTTSGSDGTRQPRVRRSGVVSTAGWPQSRRQLRVCRASSLASRRTSRRMS